MSTYHALSKIYHLLISNGWEDIACDSTQANPNDPELGDIFQLQFKKEQTYLQIGNNKVAIITIELNNRNCSIHINGWLGTYTGQMLVQNPEHILASLQWGISATCPIIKPSD